LKIIIIGGGKVGFYLAKALSAENHDVILIEQNSHKCRMLQEHLDILVIHGDGASVHTLQQSGIKEADMFVAVTNQDYVNITACVFASKMSNAFIIARAKDQGISFEEHGFNSKDFGIDLLIHSEVEVAKEIVSLVRRYSATDVVDFADGRVQLVGLKIDSDCHHVIGEQLQVLTSNIQQDFFRMVAIRRKEKTIIPTGKDNIEKGDNVFIVARTEHINDVMHFFGKCDEKLTYIMIFGTKYVGLNVAKLLEREKRFTLKILEADTTLAHRAAEVLKQSLVVQGDAQNLDLMMAEGIRDMDCFIATTTDDEDNLVACLVAKNFGVKKVISLVSKSEYIPILESIGLDAALSKRITIINTILRYIRRGQVSSVCTIAGVDAELMEFNVTEGAKITKDILRKLDLPKGAKIGMIVKNGEAQIPTGLTAISPGDRVIVFTLHKVIPDLERFFN